MIMLRHTSLAFLRKKQNADTNMWVPSNRKVITDFDLPGREKRTFNYKSLKKTTGT